MFHSNHHSYIDLELLISLLLVLITVEKSGLELLIFLLTYGFWYPQYFFHMMTNYCCYLRCRIAVIPC